MFISSHLCTAGGEQAHPETYMSQICFKCVSGLMRPSIANYQSLNLPLYLSAARRAAKCQKIKMKQKQHTLCCGDPWRRQMDRSENGLVSRELLRLMDQHLMGSRYPLPTKKGYTLEEKWADLRLQPCPLMKTGFTGLQL